LNLSIELDHADFIFILIFILIFIIQIEALLDSNFTVNPELQNSIKEGPEDMKEGRVHPHSEARKLYKKWLGE
jgi:hypothetical protein